MDKFITGNEGKFNEAKKIFPDLQRVDLDLVEIQDINPRNVIEAKLKEAFNVEQKSFIVEDTSLYLECLKSETGNLPGPLIKWFLKVLGNNGLYKLAKKYDNFSVSASVMIGYIDELSNMHFFESSINGQIVSPRGDYGFGWDQIFLPDSYDKTFAEMSFEEKNSISMRKKVFNKLKDFLHNYYDK
jgi:inosine triphosphate pyrophosphatase